MKTKKKELVIILPLSALAIMIIVSVLLEPKQGILISDTETKCKEGWIKYETDTGILCSRTELSLEELKEYG